MRRSREEKAETHQAIVAKAAQLFRERGVEGTSVGDVMHASGMTHGGFYRHFESKEALLVAALKSAFDGMLDDLSAALATIPPAEVRCRFVDGYLSSAMVANVADGCPVAALSIDAARSSDGVRATFGAGAQAMITVLADAMDGPEDQRMRRAAQTFAMAAGAMMLARASDPKTAAMVLQAVRGD